MGAEMLVLAGISASRLDQPIEFIESRNEDEAMLSGACSPCCRPWLLGPEPSIGPDVDQSDSREGRLWS